MKILFKLLHALMLAATIALSATAALANTAANTQIINKARLTYAGGVCGIDVDRYRGTGPCHPQRHHQPG